MIVFDLQALQSAAHGERGIARYVRDLAGALAREHPDVVDVFAWNDHLPPSPRFDDLGFGDRLQPFSALRGADVDVLHVNSPFELLPYREVGVPVRAGRLVVTCYDLIPYRFPERYLTDAFTAPAYRTRLGMIASADAIVTDSQSAADDLHDLVGVPRSRLTVIGAGVGDRFVPPTEPLADRIAALRDSFPELSARFVLVPTGVDWRKNIPGAIAAFGDLPTEVIEQHQLVLSCKVDEHQREWVESLAAEHGVTDRVLITGYVSDDDLVRLYQSAELVVFPSFYEGFGLPVLEARRCGARVICSEGSSLPEVLPDVRARFDASDIEAMSGLIGRALTDAKFAAVLDAVPDPGFSWSDSAARLTEVYAGLRPRRRPSSPERRLALVTLLPPTPSGIADHSERLATAIAEEVDGVDVTVYVPEVASEQIGRPYEVRPLAHLPAAWEAGETDAVLYCFGNNRWHAEFYRAMQVVPGSALLHDVRLVGMYDPLTLDQLVGTVYTTTAEREQPLLARPVARLATSVLVQSQHAADLVERDAHVTAIDVGPHPCRQLTEDEDAGTGATAGHDEAGPPWVVTLGIADATKGSDTVAAAMALLHERRDVRTAMVGLGGERFVLEGSPTVVTGRVDDDEFRAWLRRADLLVQLRRTTNGESSGVVAHAMAHGVPMVLSDFGAMAEVPSSVAVHVPVDVTPDRLADAIAELLDDPGRRATMAEAGREIASRETPAAQARRIVDALFGA